MVVHSKTTAKGILYWGAGEVVVLVHTPFVIGIVFQEELQHFALKSRRVRVIALKAAFHSAAN